jgi:very-short-patch-repair endonuclease
MRRQGATAEKEIARIASAQHGNVTRAQLLAIGLSASGIDRRLRKGALVVEFPGVYRVGHRAPSLEARYMAAVLACGEGALLFGVAAAHLLRLTKGRPADPEVITCTARRIPGIRTRQSRSINRLDRWIFNGIPVTTVARTLVDLAGVLSPKALARACHEAHVRYRTTPADVEAVLARRRNSPRAALLRRTLRGEVHTTLSDMEARFLELLRRERLPPPQTNRPAAGGYLDCRWPEYRLTVELDSYRYHNSRYSWERDRRRERLVRARGDEFRRYSRDDVMVAPRLMLRELRELLPTEAVTP